MGELKRVLGFPSVVFITINSIIGSGVFFLPALGAYYSGPSSILAWILLSIVTIYTAFCFGELVSMFPTAGGIYEFSKQAYGRFPSFLIGWAAWIVGNVTTAMLIIGAIQYLLPVTGFKAMIVKLVVCIFWVITFNLLAYRGMKTSSFMLVTFSLITLFVMTVLICISFFNIDFANYSPFFIHEGFLTNIAYIFITIFFISETFFGLETVTFLSEETKEPEKVLPKALILSISIITILTILLVAFSIGAVNSVEFSSSQAPFTLLASKFFGKFGTDFITLGTYLVIMGAAAGWIVSGPRLVLALTRDKLFIPKFNAIHKEYGTPHRVIIFQTIITVLFVVISFFGEGYKTLLSILVPMVLVIMSLAILTVTILRIKKPNMSRPFKAPFGKIGPIFVVLFYLGIMITWLFIEKNAFNILFLISSLMFFAIPIYFLLELYYNPNVIKVTNESTIYLSYLFENILLPKKVRAKIINHLGDIENKKVLDFGCNAGTMSVELMKKISSKGKLICIDSTQKEINITRERLEKTGKTNFEMIIEIDEYTKLHNKIKNIDACVSVGLLSYIQNLNNVLKELNKELSLGGKVVFLDYDKLFDIIPNIDWIDDDIVLKKYFEDAGFNITIERTQGIAWGYVYIYAEKVKNIT